MSFHDYSMWNGGSLGKLFESLTYCSSGRWQEGWNEIFFKVPLKPNCSMILFDKETGVFILL